MYIFLWFRCSIHAHVNWF